MVNDPSDRAISLLRPFGDGGELDQLMVDADTGCLRLISLLFDSGLTLVAAIDRWTACVTRRPYALESGMISP